MPATCSAGSRPSRASTSSTPSTAPRPGTAQPNTSRALEARPLGPNVAAFIGHSDMRTAVMGMDRATRKDVRPNGSRAGRDGAHAHRGARRRIPRHVVAAAALRQDRRRDLPFADAAVDLRETAGVAPAEVAAAPARPGAAVRARTSQNPLNLASQVAQSLPVLRKQAQDQPAVGRRRQVEPAGDHDAGSAGAIGQPLRRRLPLAAPAGPVRGLRRRHRPGGVRGVRLRRRGPAPARRARAQRAAARRELPRRFRKDYDNKFGLRVWHRDFFDAEIVACPDESVVGKSFGQVGLDRGGLHPVDAFLDLVLEHGTKLRWRTTISNHRPEVLKKLAARPGHPDGLLRCRRAPAQHGVLQLRAAAAAPRPRRRARRARRS